MVFIAFGGVHSIGKRAELLDVNINTGVQSIYSEKALKAKRALE